MLGGRAEKANIELHDVRWVVGSKIEDTYDTLRKDWFGSPKGLHIDSYKKIKYIDGYKINLINFEQVKLDKNHLMKRESVNEISFRPHDTTSLGTKYANKVGRGDYGSKKIDNRKKGIAMLTKKRMAALGAPTAKVPATK